MSIINSISSFLRGILNVFLLSIIVTLYQWEVYRITVAPPLL